MAALLQESLSVAHKTEALATKDLERVAVDTTVQPKNVAFPTDARLLHKAIVMLAGLARAHEVPLRQSYVRVGKRAALKAGHRLPPAGREVIDNRYDLNSPPGRQTQHGRRCSQPHR